MEILLKLVLAVLFAFCLFDMPYGYFQIVRFLGMIGFGILAYQSKKRDEEFLFFFWIASAILINPILKVSLGRTLWNAVDLIWAFTLLISIKRTQQQ